MLGKIFIPVFCKFFVGIKIAKLIYRFINNFVNIIVLFKLNLLSCIILILQ
jgi:hypothetical protein